MGTIVLVIGPAGAGKTTTTRAAVRIASERLGCGIAHVVIDELRDRLALPATVKPHSPEEERSWQQALQGVIGVIEPAHMPIVFVDGLWYGRAHIERAFAKLVGRWRLAVVHLSAALDLCLARNRERVGPARLEDDEVRSLWDLPIPDDAHIVRVEPSAKIQVVAEQILSAGGIALRPTTHGD